ncbi:MAG: efflux RND transporter periplasmic adaptor subunit [Pseudomonadota bacterium]
MVDERTERLQSLSIDRSAPEASGGVPLWSLIVVAILALMIGAAGSWLFTGGGSEEASTTARMETAPTAESTTTEPASQTQSAPPPRSSGLVASGYVVARRQATVSAEITGRISEVLIEEGFVVEAGEVVARLDDERARLDLRLLQAQLASAQRRLDSTQAQLVEAEARLGRTTQLVEREFASAAALDTARAQLDSLSAQLLAGRADVAAIRVRIESQEDFIDRHIVRAPFGGVVIAKNAQVGEILSPASAGGGFTRTGVATVVDMQSLELEVDVNENQIQRVTPGQRVEAVLDAYPDWRIPARVEAIIPTADRARATIQVRVALDERDARVLPDMAARVTFVEN